MEKKIAIRVNNEREFKALMEHYAQKGLTPGNKFGLNELEYNSCIAIGYGNSFSSIYSEAELLIYTILTFPQLASITGIKLPPSEIILNLSGLPQISVTANGATIGIQDESYLGSCLHLDIKDIEELYTAYKSLQ